MIDARDADAVAERFGLGVASSLVGPVARGELGEVWCLTTSRGRWAVKVLFDPVTEDSAAGAEECAMFQVAARAAGVPTPEVVRSLSGALFAEAGAALVRVYTWADLADADAGLDPSAVGQLVAAVHRVRFAHGDEVDGWYTDPVGWRDWEAALAAVTAAGAPFADRLAACRAELDALDRLVVPPRALRMCHRDLWADNVRSTPGGGLCVIDWENSGPADPTHELAAVMFEFCRAEPVRAAQLHGAYRERGGPGRVTALSDWSMTIAQLGHIGEMHCYGWIEATTPQERRRREAGMEEFLGDGRLTVEVVEQLLDAISSG